MGNRTSDFARDAALAKLESKLEELRCHPPLTVAELMTTDVVSCRATDTAESCARIMWEPADTSLTPLRHIAGCRGFVLPG